MKEDWADTERVETSRGAVTNQGTITQSGCTEPGCDRGVVYTLNVSGVPMKLCDGHYNRLMRTLRKEHIEMVDGVNDRGD